MGRLGSGPYLVSRIGSRVQVRASFQIFALRLLLYIDVPTHFTCAKCSISGIKISDSNFADFALIKSEIFTSSVLWH